MTLADETVAMVATVVSSGGANLAQERAIGHPVDRPLKVAAGPGTGKTYLLAERYLRLLSAEGLAPHQILALTFTNRAAGEMRERIARHGLLSGTLTSTLDLSEAWIGTFHGTCLRLLQEQPLATGLTRGLAAIDGVERQRLRADIRERLLDGALGDEGWQPDDALLLELADDGFWRGAWATVDRLQDLLVAPEEFLIEATARATRPRAEAETWASAQASTASKTSRSRDKAQAAAANASADYALLPGLAAIVATVYRAYRDELHRRGLLDFPGQIMAAYRLLTAHPAVAARYKAQFRHILVDEVQDTSGAQMRLVAALAAPDLSNVTVIGDGKQSIYGWRGARPENLARFRPAEHGGAEIVLGRNYRSYQEIVDVAAHALVPLVASGRVAAAELELIAARGSAGQPVVTLASPADPDEDGDDGAADVAGGALSLDEGRRREAAYIAARVRALLADGQRGEDIVILLRSVARADVYEQALREAGVPTLLGGGQGFFARPEVRDALALLRAAVDPLDDVALVRVMQGPLCGLSDVAVAAVARHAAYGRLYQGLARAETLPFSVPARDETVRRAQSLVALLGRIGRQLEALPLPELLQEMLQESGYLDYVRTRPEANRARALANLERLRRAADTYAALHPLDTAAAFARQLSYSLEEGLDEAEESVDAGPDVVRLMTVHQAKGLEFPVVIVADARPRAYRLDGAANVAYDEDEGFLLLKRHDPTTLETRDAADVEGYKERERARTLEEERYVWYVALTRAEQRLILTTPRPLGKKLRAGEQWPLQELYAVLTAGAPPPRLVDAARIEMFGPPRADETAATDLVSPQEIEQALDRVRAAATIAVQEETPADSDLPASPVTLSYEALRAYRACPRRYQLGHVLGLPPVPPALRPRLPAGEVSDYDPAILSKAVQQALRNPHPGNPHPQPLSRARERGAQNEVLLAAFIEACRAQGVAEDELEQLYLPHGRRLLDLYLQHAVGAGQAQRVYAELAVRQLMRDGPIPVYLVGQIDAVDLDADGWRLIDYGTPSPPTPWLTGPPIPSRGIAGPTRLSRDAGEGEQNKRIHTGGEDQSHVPYSLLQREEDVLLSPEVVKATEATGVPPSPAHGRGVGGEGCPAAGHQVGGDKLPSPAHGRGVGGEGSPNDTDVALEVRLYKAAWQAGTGAALDGAVTDRDRDPRLYIYEAEQGALREVAGDPDTLRAAVNLLCDVAAKVSAGDFAVPPGYDPPCATCAFGGPYGLCPDRRNRTSSSTPADTTQRDRALAGEVYGARRYDHGAAPGQFPMLGPNALGEEQGLIPDAAGETALMPAAPPCFLCGPEPEERCARAHLTGTLRDVRVGHGGNVRALLVEDGREVGLELAPPWQALGTVLQEVLATGTPVRLAARHLLPGAPGQRPSYRAAERSLVVLDPDTLIDVTAVATADYCGRRALVEDLSRRGGSTSMAHGSRVHAAFARGLLRGDVSLGLDADGRAGKSDIVLDEYAEAVEQLRRVADWLREHAIAGRVRTEALLLSPGLGLRGRADAVIDLDGSPTVLDLKTGSSGGPDPRREHAVQLAAYDLLLRERGHAPAANWLLYAGNAAGDVGRRVPVGRDDHARVVRLRNELAAIALLGRAPLSPYRARCLGCRVIKECRTLSFLNGEREYALGQGEEEVRSRLSDADARFYRHYSALLRLEGRAAASSVGALWRLSVEERVARGLAVLVDGAPRTVTDDDGGGEVWRFGVEHHSDLRESDTVLLSDGDPIAGEATSGVIERAGAGELVVRAQGQGAVGVQPRLVDRYSADVGTTRGLRTLWAWLSRPERLRRLVDGGMAPRFEAVVEPMIEGANEGQRRVIGLIGTARDYVLVQGPPGAGKTRTIAQAVRLLRSEGKRVLLASFTNRAVDAMLDALHDDDQRDAVRLGSTGATAAHLHHLLLDGRARAAGIVDREGRLALLEGAGLVAATVATLAGAAYDDQSFDTVIVDEASQLTVPDALAALRLAGRFVLVGDDKQLPPVVQSKAAAEIEQGLSATLFSLLGERLSASGLEGRVLLSAQYRMNEEICRFPSDEWYGGLLHPGNEGVAHGRLSLRPASVPLRWRDVLDPARPAVFVPVAPGPAKDRSGGPTEGPTGSAGVPPVPVSARAREKLAADVSPGTAAVPAAHRRGTPVRVRQTARPHTWPRGPRRSQWVTGVRGEQCTDPAVSGGAGVPPVPVSGGAGVPPVPASDRGQESSAANATRPQDNVLQALPVTPPSNADNTARTSTAEARMVRDLCAALVAGGVDAGEIGVIAPYRAQVALIRGLLREGGLHGIVTDTVDRFQGSERSVILLSLVGGSGGVSHLLRDERRLNVALTRARHKLILLGHAPDLRADPLYARLLDATVMVEPL